MSAEIVLMLALAASVALNGWLVWRVLKPVQRLAARAATVAQGDLGALQQPCGGIREVGELRHTMAAMAQHVQRAQTEGITYRHALTDGQEAERARLARELHDDTVQALIAVAQRLDLAQQWLARDPSRAAEVLRDARAQAVAGVEALRRTIAGLRPPALEELGLVAALKMLADSSGPPPATVTVSGLERRIDAAHELALFRVAQEAATNARRHAQAAHLTLALDFQPQAVGLTVTDDGVGFCPPAALDDLARDAHYGLIGMAERVKQAGGTLDITSRPGGGTVIRVVLPVPDAAQPDSTVRDPVCGAEIQPQQAYGSTVYAGQQYYFCCPVCQGAFQRAPETYLSGEFQRER